ncbi:nickel transporter [Granulicella sp. WH15]|uniref:nickel transporter n=1 Tax=Granulicella sp. WH15 TaxID=2602070 RepID=UPI0013678E5F|nr:nickel transporter [Granulicella sp. WH15]QHN02661.1 nickel transporter [Granulicella sp. WH15]
MRGAALISVVAALGMRHGVDPDHLSIIDGLARFHPSRWNGVLFAVGHGIIVTILAVGFGKLLAGYVEPYTPWILLLLGVANLWRLWRPKQHKHPKPPRLFQASPLLLGVLLGMGFETASQLSAILLAGQLNPWILGLVFSLGMMLVDGTDGILAARTQQLALTGDARSMQSSRALGVLVVIVSFGLAGGEFAGIDLNRVALPLGLLLFAGVVGLRLWSGRTRQHQPLSVAKGIQGGRI